MHTEPDPKPLNTKAPSDPSMASPQSRRRGARHRFLSVADAAIILGTSDVTLYRAIRSHQFPAIKIRGRYVVPAKVLDALENAALSSGAMIDAADWVDGNRSA